MQATQHTPSPRRVPPAAWTAAAWGLGTVLTLLFRVRLPGQSEPDVYPGAQFYRWDALTVLTLATVLTVAGGCLQARRLWPGLVLMLAGAATASTALGVAEIPLTQFLAVDVALYLLAASRPRRTAIAATALALCVLAGYLAVRLLHGWPVGTSAELTVALTAVIACLAGDSARQAREREAGARTEAAARAVAAERLRISRELHDAVAHSLGVIALQAGAAARVIETRPERAREALTAIEITGRETLSGLRRILGALRHAGPGADGPDGSPPVPREPASLGPAPGLADIDRLAEATTAAGVRVDVCRVGDRRPLPPEIDVSAYRIVQEAVTNVIRHAGTRSCRVLIDQRDDELSIEIVDGGRGHGRATEPGYGLIGMRERVALLRGELTAAPRPEGGFRVAARLPVPAAVR